MYKSDSDFISIFFLVFSFLLSLMACAYFFLSIPQAQEIEPTYTLEKIEDINWMSCLFRDPLTDVLYLFYSNGGYTVMLNADETPVTYDQYIAVYGEPDES